MRNWIQSIAVVTICLGLIACSSTPELKHSTRTGKIHDIRVGEQLQPQQLEVHLGDEVRWINSRSAPIDVAFVDDIKDRLSCQNGFVTGGFFKGIFSENAPVARITTIQPNEYASLCFAAAGEYMYNTRMQSVTPGGEKNFRGNVLVR